MSRQRTIQQQPANGGNACGELSEERQCNTRPCKTDCVTGPWGAFSQCSKACGGGVHTRTRAVTTPQEGAGAKCGELTEKSGCNTEPCAQQGKDACEVAQWTPYTTCTKACGGGTQTRQRQVVKPSQSGQSCGALEESRKCNTAECSAECLAKDSRILPCIFANNNLWFPA